MCDMCINPMKPFINEDNELVFPVESARAGMEQPPAIEGWEPLAVMNHVVEGYPDIICVVYRQPLPVFFVSQYREHRCYGGPEEGGWGYNERELVAVVSSVITSDRRHAERMCRSLNRLARKNDVAPGHYLWGTSGLVFTVDRFPGEDDTAMDPRPHYW